MTTENAPKSGLAASWLLIGIALIILLGWVLPNGWNFLAILLLMTAIVGGLGMAIVHNPLGAFINEDNVMSLSRFQVVLWTIVVLAAYFAYSIARMKAGHADPLAVAIDWRLWALMGISTTSFVTSAVILNDKKDKEPDPSETAETAKQLGEDAAAVDQNRRGLVYGNPTKGDARLTDMFQGDEIANTAHVDLSKLQMFYFTAISIAAFVVMIFRALPAGDLDKLPELPDGLIALLGISHAGYLGAKNVTKTPVAAKKPSTPQ